jgi:hypothetical protein
VRHLIKWLPLAALMLTPMHFAIGQESCDSIKAQRDKLKQDLEKLEAQKFPEDRLGDLDNILGQIVDLLKANAGDQKDITEKISELQKQLPNSDSATVKAINDFVDSVKGGLFGSAKMQEDAQQFLSDARARLNVIRGFYAAGKEKDAGPQIEAFGRFFDDMTGTIPGIKEVPGLKDLFGAYSQAIHGIAISAGKIDEQMASRRQTAMNADELGRDFSPRGKTPREIRADEMNRLGRQLTALEANLANGGCQDADKSNGCADPKNRVVQDMKVLHRKLDPDHDLQAKQDDAICQDEWNAALSAAREKQSATSEADRADAQRRYDLHRKAWGECSSKRAQHERDYEQKIGDLLDLASQNEHWTPAEEKTLADCFWYDALLRDRSRLRPKSTPQPDTHLANCHGFQGTWRADYSSIAFTVTGNRAVGTYSWQGNGTISGTIDGQTLTGTWTDGSGNGTLSLTLDGNKNGQAFSGKWTRLAGNGSPGGSWAGSCSSK